MSIPHKRPPHHHPQPPQDRTVPTHVICTGRDPTVTASQRHESIALSVLRTVEWSEEEHVLASAQLHPSKHASSAGFNLATAGGNPHSYIGVGGSDRFLGFP